jgi:hypothetical protein
MFNAQSIFTSKILAIGRENKLSLFVNLEYFFYG